MRRNKKTGAARMGIVRYLYRVITDFSDKYWFCCWFRQTPGQLGQALPGFGF
jgi:hypothetical protein